MSISSTHGHLFIQVFLDMFEDDRMDVDLPKQESGSKGKKSMLPHSCPTLFLTT